MRHRRNVPRVVVSIGFSACMTERYLRNVHGANFSRGVVGYLTQQEHTLVGWRDASKVGKVVGYLVERSRLHKERRENDTLRVFFVCGSRGLKRGWMQKLGSVLSRDLY